MFFFYLNTTSNRRLDSNAEVLMILLLSNAPHLHLCLFHNLQPHLHLHPSSKHLYLHHSLSLMPVHMHHLPLHILQRTFRDDQLLPKQFTRAYFKNLIPVDMPLQEINLLRIQRNRTIFIAQDHSKLRQLLKRCVKFFRILGNKKEIARKQHFLSFDPHAVFFPRLLISGHKTFFIYLLVHQHSVTYFLDLFLFAGWNPYRVPHSYAPFPF